MLTTKNTERWIVYLRVQETLKVQNEVPVPEPSNSGGKSVNDEYKKTYMAIQTVS